MSDVFSQIDEYEPSGDSWADLEELVARIRAGRTASLRMRGLYKILERLPDAFTEGILEGLRHDLEAMPGYAPELVASVRRTPSEVTVGMINALLNSGTGAVGKVNLVDLLRDVALNEDAAESVRETARDYCVRHGGKFPTVKPTKAKAKPKASAKPTAKAKGKGGASANGDALVALLGKKKDAQELCALEETIGEKGKASGQDQDGAFLGYVKTGFSFHHDRKGILKTVYIPSGFKKDERCALPLPLGLSVDDTRAQVRKKLGTPDLVHEYKKGTSIFNSREANDLFDLPEISVSVVYEPDGSRVRSVQVDSAESAARFREMRKKKK